MKFEEISLSICESVSQSNLSALTAVNVAEKLRSNIDGFSADELVLP